MTRDARDIVNGPPVKVVQIRYDSLADPGRPRAWAHWVIGASRDELITTTDREFGLPKHCSSPALESRDQSIDLANRRIGELAVLGTIHS